MNWKEEKLPMLKKNINASIISDTNAKFSEAVLLSINTVSAKQLVIGCCYHSPNSSS